MPVLTATEVTSYSNITASAATIAASGLIATVQERVVAICNNTFGTDLDLQQDMIFNATGRTITATGSIWASYGFAAGDDVFVYRSYRNDGFYTVSSISGSVLTLATGASVVDELSGRTILVSVVKWPLDLKQTAALMVEYDYDTRPKRAAGVRSRSLGPFSESYGEAQGALGALGYPEDLVGPLYDHRIVRLV